MEAVKSSKPASYQTAPRYINDLHPFDGNPSEWLAFKATYRDAEDYFSGIQNLARLRRAIQGKAKDSIKSMLYTENNPAVIITALERRYGKPSYLVKSEIAAIEKLAPLAEDARNIVSFAGAVTNTVCTIKQMNQLNYLHSSDLSEKILRKMSTIVKYDWFKYRTLREDEPILPCLADFLNELADRFEAFDTTDTKPRERQLRGKYRTGKVHCTRETYSSEEDIESDYSEASQSSSDESTEATETVAATYGRKKEEKCPFCDSGSHEAKLCKRFGKADVEKRWELVKSTKVCFRCLKGTHRSFVCRAKPCSTCKRGHHKLLHMDRGKTDEKKQPEEKPEKEQSLAKSTTTEKVNTLCAARAYLKMVPIEVTGPKGTVTVHALLDEGSTVTLIEQHIAEKIGAKGPREELSIEGVGGQKMKAKNCESLHLRVRGQLQRNYESMVALTIDELDLAPQTIRKKDIQDCEHLQDMIDNLTYDRAKPTVLIGQDNWHLIVTRELKSGHRNQPVASYTKLGWVLHGCNTSTSKPVAVINHLRDYRREIELETTVKEYFSLESLGIEPKKPKNDPEERALTLLENTSKRLQDGRFETGLIWKTDNEAMPPSKEAALKRFKSIEKKMNNDGTFKEKYTAQIHNLLKNGYAEPATEESTSPRTWYLPHFAVIHPQKLKMRLVFDAAARVGGKCLNDALSSGPDLLQSLFGVLLRFREGPIAVMADIKEMFLRVKIREEDRDSLRFLWRNNTNEPLKEYRMSSLIFGAVSSPCTAIYVKNKNAKEFDAQHPEAARAIVRNHYMDDYLQSFYDAEKARRIATEVNEVHKKAGFHLRGWSSNDPTVIAGFENENQEKSKQLGNQENVEKTLGLKWNIASDSFSFTLNLRNTPQETLQGLRAPTKREVTSAVMSVFDPLGFASPITIQGKILIQDIWRSGIDWDEQINAENQKLWTKWLTELKKLASLNIPRCVSKYETSGELHTFADASEKAYAAAVYWRTA